MRSILVNQSIPAILALGATIPIVTGRFDLSIGYGIGLAHVVAMWLLVNRPRLARRRRARAASAVSSSAWSTALLVEFAQIDSFIATFGTGSVLYALTGWITGGGRIVPGIHGLPSTFTDLTNSSVFGLPIPFLYVVVLVAGPVAGARVPAGSAATSTSSARTHAPRTWSASGAVASSSARSSARPW